MNATFLVFFLVVEMTLVSRPVTPTYDLTFQTKADKPDSLKPGDTAPTFVLRNIMTGDPVFLKDYTGEILRRGSKNTTRHAVVLSFWATWCEPCKKEIPILMKLADEYKDKPVKFFLINTQEQTKEPTYTEDSVKLVLQARHYTLPCLVDAIGRAADSYRVRILPVLVVIDKRGIIRKISHGYEENLETVMSNLLSDLVKE